MSSRMNKVYIALGSNLGDRQANLMSAILHLRTFGVGVKRCSSIWETEPVGITDQPWFFNAVTEAETEMSPLELLRLMKRIEQAMGRELTAVNGPRILDIDLLFYGNECMQSEELELPHPRLQERRFVLQPMMELAPDFRHPISGLSIKELLTAAPALEMTKFVP